MNTDEAHAQIQNAVANGDLSDEVLAVFDRMQNAINWASRAAGVDTFPHMRAYFIGRIKPELSALDDGTPLLKPTVKEN